MQFAHVGLSSPHFIRRRRQAISRQTVIHQSTRYGDLLRQPVFVLFRAFSEF